MKKIGLLGGFTWTSTLDYYKILNERIQEKAGGYNSFECIIHSVQFAGIMQLLGDKNWKGVEDMVALEARKVEQSGAEALVICSNTIAKVAPEVANQINIPLIDIIEAAGSAIKKTGVKKAGFLGTGFTMRDTFYQNRLKEEYGVEAITPPENDIDYINRAILDELGKGIIKQETKIRFLEIMNNLKNKHQLEAMVLGCTEIPLLVKNEDCNYPLFNTLEIHVDAIIKSIFGDE